MENFFFHLVKIILISNQCKLHFILEAASLLLLVSNWSKMPLIDSWLEHTRDLSACAGASFNVNFNII